MRLPLLFGLACLHAVPAMAQNTCATALPIVPGTYVVSAVDGTDAIPFTCATNGGSPTAAEWYTYTATEDTTMRINTDVPGVTWVDTRVNIYTGTCGSLTCHAGDDDGG